MTNAVRRVRMKRWLALVALLVAARGAAPAWADTAPAGSRGLLWQIDGPASAPPSYLFGSIHLGVQEMYPLSKAVDDAYSRSEVLVLEARSDQAGAVQQTQMVLKGLYTTGGSLSDDIPAPLWKQTVAAGTRFGLNAEALGKMRPWMAALMLGVLGVKASGYDEKLGVEMHFLGRLGKRPVEELEGMQAQIDLFSTLSQAEQVLFLRYTLRDLDSIKSELGRMVRAWKRGDLDAFQSLMVRSIRKEPSLAPIYRKLITDRNRTMAQRIDELIKQGKPLFVVIGSGHLAGKDGVIELLRQRGFKLRQR
jgi:uncharacterized protein YbaP (TraB family)